MLRALLLSSLALCLPACGPSEAAENVAAFRTPALAPAPPAYMAPEGQAHFRRRLSDIRSSMVRGGVVFAGDSLTEGCAWDALFPGTLIQNQGIGWDTTDGLISRLGYVIDAQPGVIYLTIGTNDIGYGRSGAYIARNIGQIARTLAATLPRTQIYIGAILPQSSPDTSAQIRRVNQDIAAVLSRMNLRSVRYYDASGAFAGRAGTLGPDLTYDGIHLTPQGCEVWSRHLPR